MSLLHPNRETGLWFKELKARPSASCCLRALQGPHSFEMRPSVNSLTCLDPLQYLGSGWGRVVVIPAGWVIGVGRMVLRW